MNCCWLFGHSVVLCISDTFRTFTHPRERNPSSVALSEVSSLSLFRKSCLVDWRFWRCSGVAPAQNATFLCYIAFANLGHTVKMWLTDRLRRIFVSIYLDQNPARVYQNLLPNWNKTSHLHFCLAKMMLSLVLYNPSKVLVIQLRKHSLTRTEFQKENMFHWALV